MPSQRGMSNNARVHPDNTTQPHREGLLMTVEIFLFALVGAMAIGVPVAFSLILCGLALMLYMGIFDSQIVALKLIEGADNFQLLALPFFLLAGELMNAGGLSKRIIGFALSLVGHLHGGL